MKKILFVLHEGIGNTIFNSQVLEHCIDLSNKGMDIEILSYNVEQKLRRISYNNYCNICKQYPNVRIMLHDGINSYYPLSRLLNFVLLFWEFVKRKEEYIIHARSNYSAFVSLGLKLFKKTKIVWDCRGDSVSELEDALSRKSFFFKLYGYLVWLPLERIQIYFLARYADAAIFVSDSLYSLYQKKIRTSHVKIIPCVVSERKFYYSDMLRNQMREQYSITKNDNVFIYSGSMVAYQSLHFQRDLFMRLSQNENNYIFYITSEVEKANQEWTNFKGKRFFILHVPFDMMNNYLNMADFAILLRDDKLLNRVASPTKFGEYCLTGLKVIMNNVVNQAWRYSLCIGNNISYETINYTRSTSIERKKIVDKAMKFYSRGYLSEKYIDLYESL